MVPRVGWMQAANQKGNLLRPVGLDEDTKIRLAPDMFETDAIKQVESGYYKDKFLPRVIIMFGRRGQGKTLWQTAILAILKNRHMASGHRHKVMTNYYVNFADYYSPYIMDEMHNFPPWAQDAIIALDEIAELLPSTRTMATYNLLSGTFLRQIRKRNCEILGATQFPQEISRSVLRQTDFFVECELVDNGKGVKTYWWDWWGQITGRYDHKYFPPMKGTHDYSFTLYGTNKMFGEYRTEEVIASVYAGEQARQRIVNQQYARVEREEGRADESMPTPLDVGPSEASDEGSLNDFEAILEVIDNGDRLYLSDVLEYAKAQYPEQIRSVPTLRRFLAARGYLMGKDPNNNREFGIKQE